MEPLYNVKKLFCSDIIRFLLTWFNVQCVMSVITLVLTGWRQRMKVNMVITFHSTDSFQCEQAGWSGLSWIGFNAWIKNCVSKLVIIWFYLCVHIIKDQFQICLVIKMCNKNIWFISQIGIIFHHKAQRWGLDFSFPGDFPPTGCFLCCLPKEAETVE